MKKLLFGALLLAGARHGLRLARAMSALTLALGFAVSFVVAWAAVVAFLRVVARVSLTPFALYRVALAAVYALVVLR